jgi:acyl-coenzyme A thioesterase PaaI-like protein
MRPGTKMTRDEVEAFLDEVFPQRNDVPGAARIEEVGPLTSRLRMACNERHLRPGGTISGPAMMALADVALYAAILANIGPAALRFETVPTFVRPMDTVYSVLAQTSATQVP